MWVATYTCGDREGEEGNKWLRFCDEKRMDSFFIVM